MYPFLFHIGSTGIPAFFFMIMVGTLAGTWTSLKFAKKEGLSEIVVLDLAIIAIIASMVGARVFHVLIEAPMYYWEKPVRVFYFWQGGFVSLGAFIFSSLSWVVYLRIKRLNILRYIDVVAGAVPVVIFFVRLGCLLNGCCYGKPFDGWPYLIFKERASTACLMKFCNIPLHPSQIYFMINAVVMFFVLLLVRKYRTFYGQVLAAFLMYEGVSRFFIEFTRGDADRGIWFGGALSTGQIVMCLFFATGALIWTFGRKRRIDNK